jgi:acetyl-CoA C-acetyltransferase
MENMSAGPHLVRNIRWGLKFGDLSLIDSMLYDGLWDVYNNFLMGMTGERIAEKYGISRKEADVFSLESNPGRRGQFVRKFRAEIIPVDIEEASLILTNASVRTSRWRDLRRFLRCSKKTAS